MKYFITFFLLLFADMTMAQNQIVVLSEYPSYELASSSTFSSARKSSWLSGLTRDTQLIYRPRSPRLMAMVNSTAVNYWMSSMTTQSYNQGKLGTYYLWDVQGNLRESHTFLDIAGKNKRGLKLVFRKR